MSFRDMGHMLGAAVVLFREGHMLGAAVVSFREGHMLGQQ